MPTIEVPVVVLLHAFPAMPTAPAAAPTAPGRVRRAAAAAAAMPVCSDQYGPLIGVLDEGTRTCRFAVLDSRTLQEVDRHAVEVRSLRPGQAGQAEHEGWVEQDPMEVLAAARTCIAEVLQRVPAARVATLGVTNQRETTIVWDRHTGQPLHHALMWNDIRTGHIVDAVVARLPDRNQNHLKDRCGLPVSPYFSAVKLRWLLDNVPAVRRAVEEKRCLFGTVDTWLVWNLTGGPNGGLHITDVTNASRTMLMNINTLQWDPVLCKTFEIPMDILPEIHSCSEIYGEVLGGPLDGTPISAIMGNQQASLVGERCFKEGQAKNTYRSGCFLLYNTGSVRVQSKHGLLSTVAYKMGPTSPTVYALEGSVAVAGHAIKWLKDNLNLLDDPAETERLAEAVKSTGDVYFVPAFTGLYAPHWRKDARGILCGLTQFTNKGHIIRASLEAVCYQTRDILEAMARDCGNLGGGVALSELRADGKMASNNLLLQLQADLCGVPVVRSDVIEKATLGVAMAAGQSKGINLVNLDALPQVPSKRDIFMPSTSDEDRKARYDKWKMALTRSLGWATTSKSSTMTGLRPFLLHHPTSVNHVLIPKYLTPFLHISPDALRLKIDKRFHLLASIPPSLFLISTFAMMLASEL